MAREDTENELKHSVQRLKMDLELKNQEAENNAAVSEILNKFIQSGQAYVDEDGSVKIVQKVWA